MTPQTRSALALSLAMAWALLGTGCDSGSGAPSMESTQRPQPLRSAEEGLERPLVQFAHWLTAYRQLTTAERRAQEAEGERLARARRAALVQLIERDPQRALEWMVPLAARQGLPPSVASQLEERIDAVVRYEVIGTLWEAQAEGPALERFAQLGGQRFRVFTYGARWATTTRERLVLHGLALEGRLAMSDQPLRRLEAGEETAKPVVYRGACASPTRYDGGDTVYALCDPEQVKSLSAALEDDGTAASAYTTGTKQLLYIKVAFTDAPGDPNPNAASSMNTASTHLRDASYNLLNVQTTVAGPFIMPKTKAQYESSNAYTQLMQDARAAASAAGYNGSNYQMDVVAFAKFNSWGWAGRGYVGAKGTWLNGSFGLKTTVHELGHNLGLQHANFWQAPNETIIGSGTSAEYGNVFDIMGSGQGHYNAWYKSELDWLLPAAVETVTANTTVRVYDLESFTTGGKQAIEVPITSSRSYWVEYRPQHSASAHGALLNWGFDNRVSSQLLDMVPWTSAATDSALAIGRTFADPAANIYITPIGKGGTSPESLDVVVNVGPQGNNQPPTVTLTASATQVSPGASVTFTAAASDPNGDALAYDWNFGDGSLSTNASTVNKSWSSSTEVLALVTVSDMKGGVATAQVTVRVGSPSSFKIQGTVRQGATPMEGARVSAGAKFTFTDSNGNYTLVGLNNGNYQVTAVKPGWTVVPAGFTNPVTVGGADVANIHFDASRATFSVSGQVTSGGVGVPGITVSAGAFSGVTNGSGDYTIFGVPNGSYQLLAQAPGQTFEASNFTNPVTVNGANLANKNFIQVVFDISGEVTGLAGPHTITDGTRSVQSTQVNGKWVYTLNRVPPGTWNVIATAPGQNLVPTNFTNPLTVTNANLTNQNFDAQAGTVYLVRGHVQEGGVPLEGTTVSDGTRSGKTDGMGNYVITGVPDGAHTLTPSKPGYVFSPGSLNITVSGADSLGNDFGVLNANGPPQIVIPARADVNPVTTTKVMLTVLADDDGGEPDLVYTWNALFATAPVSYSRNGTNGAKDTEVTFTKAGAYTFEVTAEDLLGLKVKSQATVLVIQQPTSVVVTPSTAQVEVDSDKQFVASLTDQFGTHIDHGKLPEWSVNGGGTLSPTGKFSAKSKGDWVVTAQLDGRSGTAQVKVVEGPVPRVVVAAKADPNPVFGDETQLSVLGADDEGEEKLTYTWSAINPPGLVTFSDNGTPTAKNCRAKFAKEGSYNLKVELKDELGLSTSSFLNVVVHRGLTRLLIEPSSQKLYRGSTFLFTAKGYDQAEAEVALNNLTWSVSGGGSIDSQGAFTAGEELGTFTLTVHSGLKSATATVEVTADVDDLPQPGSPGGGGGSQSPSGLGCSSGGGGAGLGLWAIGLLGLALRRPRFVRGAWWGALLAMAGAGCTESSRVSSPVVVTPTSTEVGQTRQELGEVLSGYPNDQERMVHVLLNQARHSATTPNNNECGDWTQEVGADVKKVPLVWNHQLGVASRFTGRHQSEVGCYQHDNCCQLGDAGLGTIGCIAPADCAGTGCSKTCDAGVGSTSQDRFNLFGANTFSGESIAMLQSNAYQLWCSLMLSADNRQSIYGQHTEVGVGGYLAENQTCNGRYWVVGFGSGMVQAPRIPAASAMYNPPQPANPLGLYFAANYFDPSGAAPQRSFVVVSGHCFDLEKKWGHEDNGTYEARFIDPDVLPDGCHPYYFVFVDGAGQRHVYPDTGSLMVPVGLNASCPLSYDPSPQIPADCETGMQQCPAGAEQSCFTADPSLLRHGECRQGYQVCKNGFWSSCRDMIGPFPETCDGLDNDCDGEIDEGNPGANASCEVVGERGPCKAGKKECISGRLTCVSVVPPAPETCDGVDNDCDGAVDDGFPALSCGVGECYQMVAGCTNGVAGSCTPGIPQAEVEDQKDNDCDGVIDNGFPCNPGQVLPCLGHNQLGSVLPCKAGSMKCQPDAGWGPCNNEVYPQPEVCDGVDNDCDTDVDENQELGWARCGTGGCVSFGQVCRNGSPQACNPKASTAEVCNGEDSDCDGVIDESCHCRVGDFRVCYSGPSVTRGVGVCKEGKRPCVDGQYLKQCQEQILPSQEFCNGLDDDCDGTVDNDCLPLPDGGDLTDGGAPPEDDAGTTQPDGGVQPGVSPGCGCTGSAAPSLGLWGLILVGAWASRRRRTMGPAPRSPARYSARPGVTAGCETR